jgi:glycosyltransferase involved in cell wall biosynthesis
MTAEEPLVSVYLPTHNRAMLLTRAIESVLCQTFTNFELIIVDDGSSDTTPEILRHFAARDSRVKALRSEKSQGAPIARNMAIYAARGVYLTGIDDDDEMQPTRLDELLKAYRPEFSLISSSAVRKTPEWSTILHAGTKIIHLDDLLYRNIVGTQALTLRDRVVTLGGFDAAFKASQDYDLWIRLVERYGPAKRINSPSYVIHEHASASRISDQKLFGAQQIIEKHGRIMNDKHLQSRQLEMLMMSNETLRLMDLVKLVNQENIAQAGRYFVTCRLPWLRRVANRLRRATSARHAHRD